MLMKDAPLSEVFGFPPLDNSDIAIRHRADRLCPFNNIGPNCTKDKKDDPLGVCSVFHGSRRVITCPIRFREEWRIASDAARFLFPQDTKWTFLSEIRMKDASGKSAGVLDLILVAYDADGLITDYGALEIQAVYISGNARTPFQIYMRSPEEYRHQDWSRLLEPPKPDFLSSLKRLIPQLLIKSRILRAWGRRMAVAIDAAFFDSLPAMREVGSRTADLVWLVYELQPDASTGRLHLTNTKSVYTDLRETIAAMTEPEIGPEKPFLELLQRKLKEKLDLKGERE
jgi:hypothetical protein